jgi:hypothetical protein
LTGLLSRREALPNGRTPAFQGGVEGSYIKLNIILTGKPRSLGQGASIVIFIFDRINPSTIFRTYGAGRINWIYCFLGFLMKPRNNNPAFRGKRKPKELIGIFVKCSCHFFFMF